MKISVINGKKGFLLKQYKFRQFCVFYMNIFEKKIKLFYEKWQKHGKNILKYLFFNAFCKSVLKFLEQIFVFGPQSLHFLFTNEAKSNRSIFLGWQGRTSSFPFLLTSQCEFTSFWKFFNLQSTIFTNLFKNM